MAARALKLKGYTVLEAGNGAEALLVLERYERPVHLMFTDVVMPLIGGLELATRLDALRPGTKVLFTSGMPSRMLKVGVSRDVGFVPKPYTPADVVRRIRAMLDS